MDGILEKSDGQRIGDIKGLMAEPAWYWPRKKTLRVYIVHAAARAGKYRQNPARSSIKTCRSCLSQLARLLNVVRPFIT